jgi:hypothetical protein
LSEKWPLAFEKYRTADDVVKFQKSVNAITAKKLLLIARELIFVAKTGVPSFWVSSICLETQPLC